MEFTHLARKILNVVSFMQVFTVQGFPKSSFVCLKVN